MRRSHARPSSAPEGPPAVSFDDLVAACEASFSAGDYVICRDDPVSTVWVRSGRCGYSVGLQVSQVSRVGLLTSISRVKAKLDPSKESCGDN